MAPTITSRPLGLPRSHRCFAFPSAPFSSSANLKLADNAPNSPAPVNPPNLKVSCPNHCVFGATARYGFVFGKESERCAGMCDCSPHAHDDGGSPHHGHSRHIMVINVYEMLISRRAVT